MGEQPGDVVRVEADAPVRRESVDAGRRIRAMDADAARIESQPEGPQGILRPGWDTGWMRPPGTARLRENGCRDVPCGILFAGGDSEVAGRRRPAGSSQGHGKARR